MSRRTVAAIPVVLAMLGLSLFGHRLAPKPPNVLERNGIIYTADTLLGDSVEAVSKKTGSRCWRRQIYVVRYDYTLETDVQDVFITKLEFKGKDVLVTNERGYQYLLDTQTLKVAPVLGSILIDKAKHRKLP